MLALSGFAATRRLLVARAARPGAAWAAAAAPEPPRERRAALATKARPVSPHVFIYDWPVAAISSIMTRITGAALSVGIYGIALGSLAGADMAGVMSALGASAVGPLVKLGVAFPLAYHFMGATRHFYWEKNPAGLNPESQKNSSLAIFAASGVVSLAAMVV
jgi:succinate dehydrogenase (ubiquinone) cytochrome b560 subunit